MSKKRRGRGIDHCWKLVKYRGDTAIYGKCSCGYRYACSKVLRDDGSFKTVVDENKIFPYCPHCGSHKKWYVEEITYIDRFYWE